MSSCRYLLPCLVLASLTACGPRAGSDTAPTGPVEPSLRQDTLEQLTIPPGDGSLEAIRSLETLGDNGNTRAAWERTHYLLDLFDAARFGRDESSLSLLAEVAGRPRDSMHGPAATQALAELLVLESDRVLEIDRRHPEGQRARVIAGYDAAGPSTREHVFQAMQELKRIRKQGGSLAVSASLRLFAYCRGALADARDFSRPGQRVALSHCLYPLFEADPDPYFADVAVQRPPAPAIGRILDGQRALLDVGQPGRLSSALQTQKLWLEKYSENPGLAPAVDPLALRLAPATRAQPYDDYPVLVSGAKQSHIRAQMLNDGRRTLAVALGAERPSTEILQAAEDAIKLGAERLAVLVATRQRLRAPSGDYWSDQIEDEHVWRTGEIALSLAPLLTAKSDRPDQGKQAKASSWSQRRAHLSLHLLVSPSEWTLVSPQGRLARVTLDDKERAPTARLRAILARVRAAFPEEQGLVLVPQAGASVSSLVLAAEASSHDDSGRHLFARLAVALSHPKVRPGKALLARVERRAAATLQVDPPVLANRVPSALQCYRRLADKRKAPVGEVRLELTSSGTVKAKGGSKALQECAERAFAPAMLKQKLRAVRATFSARGK